VKSGALVLPKPFGVPTSAWDRLELEAMEQVVGWYGKTWHTWQVDKHPDLPLGEPRLMGSLTAVDQADLEKLLESRDKQFEVDHREKAKQREGIPVPDIHPNADSWFREERK